MFLTDLPAIPYSDPWNLPLAQRLRALKSGRHRVAYFYEAANNSTFRYRAYNMAQVLNSESADGCCGSYFFQEDLHRIDEIADSADVLVICRSAYNHKINQLIAKFRLRRKRVYFDIDDFVFDTSYAHLIINTLGLDMEDPKVWEDWFAMISRMGHTLRMCDGAITTNSYLARRISEFSGLPVKVVPNFMNQEQLELSERVFAEKQSNGFARDDAIHLGYFSGSPSHRLDYAIVEPALEQVLESDSRTRLMVVGYIDTGPSLSRFGSRITRQPFHDYVNLQRLISRVEFNLMPLQSNVFTHCKSELKYFEAAVVGTLSIASPSHNYAAAIGDGENGYIARAHQWVSVIRRAIANLEKYPDMANRAHSDVLAKYTWLVQRDLIKQALGFE
jgi:glycosyltransferase involved in cell wall biosynthesis